MLRGNYFPENLLTITVNTSEGISLTPRVARPPMMPAYKQWVSFIFTRLEQLNSDTLTLPTALGDGGK